MRTRLLISCEHASNAIPASYRELFRGQQQKLASHQGLDIGALAAARLIARQHAAGLHAAQWSRLLVDLNRSLGHPRLFSTISRELPAKVRERILAQYYHPWRQAVTGRISAFLAAGDRVLHISVHSFTPALDGHDRHCDIGLLYDPSRKREREFCASWRAALLALDPGLVVRRNYPYRGTADGFVTALRREFPASRYSGVELEINQRFPLGPAARWQQLQKLLAASCGRGHSRLTAPANTQGKGGGGRSSMSGTCCSRKSRRRPRLV